MIPTPAINSSITIVVWYLNSTINSAEVASSILLVTAAAVQYSKVRTL